MAKHPYINFSAEEMKRNFKNTPSIFEMSVYKNNQWEHHPRVDKSFMDGYLSSYKLNLFESSAFLFINDRHYHITCFAGKCPVNLDELTALVNFRELDEYVVLIAAKLQCIGNEYMWFLPGDDSYGFTEYSPQVTIDANWNVGNCYLLEILLTKDRSECPAINTIGRCMPSGTVNQYHKPTWCR